MKNASTPNLWGNVVKTHRLVSAVSKLPRQIIKRIPLILDANFIPTNRCTQHCGMCNSGVIKQSEQSMLTLNDFKFYESRLKKYSIPICTISGGEPVLVPEMPAIIEEAAKNFQLGVILISNFYSRTNDLFPIMESALRNNVHIVCSLDGFGEVGDRCRGSRNVSKVVTDHVALVSSLKQKLGSSSILEIHTVVSDWNISQFEDILQFSQNMGWLQTICPINVPQDILNNTQSLNPRPELQQKMNLALRSKHVNMMSSFIKGINGYANFRHKKYCPYLTWPLKTFKIFIEANGDITLCDRKAIGNLIKNDLDEIFSSQCYFEFLERAQECKGCWLSCFTEPALAVNSWSFMTPSFWRRLSLFTGT
jgi:MoaA/NifB/PqqE/SkfB family radical SAM enzyme